MATTTKVKRIMTQPINLIFRFLQSRQKIQIWLYDHVDMRIEGRIIVRAKEREICKIARAVGVPSFGSHSLTRRDCFGLAKACRYLIQSLVHYAQGFDEYMNLVLDEAEEVSMKRDTRKPLGRILLKGDNITVMQAVRA
ncbi:hypothetical protein H632_c181p1 [Helicosporidium sp. ATCC 50920]|nr:hypothetical protein H632_c181p1 [Helicosporidium sp. ATCC 50920]|eukprot:KDD76561.1 hypothetical protein H632_c181p1 [Helicosporidium sp. ATCC 50920]